MTRRHVVLAMALALLLTACGGGSPAIALEQDALDLGEVPMGDIRSAEVQIENVGGRPLVIEAVTTSCGCTEAEVEPKTLEAGSSGVLQIRYDSGAHGPDFRGVVERQIFIASNDPDQREVLLTVRAMVVDP